VPHTTYGDTEKWQTVGCRIHPNDYKKLMERAGDQKGKVSKILRALISMYLEGKINKLEYTIKETIG
jgi:hypothetical protein